MSTPSWKFLKKMFKAIFDQQVSILNQNLNNQVFTLSFHLAMSEFLLEKEQEK